MWPILAVTHSQFPDLHTVILARDLTVFYGNLPRLTVDSTVSGVQREELLIPRGNQWQVGRGPGAGGKEESITRCRTEDQL